jgi:hypothetical protein
MPHPVQQCAGDSLDLCMAICLLLCSRPCQMVTSNFRALATIAFCLPTRAATRSNWADPLGVLFDGHPCCLNHHSTQLTAPFLGDAPCAIGLPRLLNAGRLSQHSPPGAKLRENGSSPQWRPRDARQREPPAQAAVPETDPV